MDGVEPWNLGSFALGREPAQKNLCIYFIQRLPQDWTKRETRRQRHGAIGGRLPWFVGVFGTDFAWGSDRPHLLPVYVIYILSLYLASHGDIPPKGYGWGRRLFVITFIDTPRCVGRGLVLSATVSNSGGPLQTGQTRPAMWGTSIRRAIMHTKPFDTFTYLELEPVI